MQIKTANNEFNIVDMLYHVENAFESLKKASNESKTTRVRECVKFIYRNFYICTNNCK